MHKQKQEDLTLSCVTTFRELTALRHEWEALWRVAPSATPFNTPAWLLAWWQTFGNTCLRAFVVRKDRHLVGLLPAYLLDGRLQLLGIGISDYLDLLAEPELEQEVSNAVLRATTAPETGWREVEFQNLAAHSPLLHQSTATPWKETRFVQDVCPVLRLPTDGKGLQQIIPASQYKEYSYSRRRVERDGNFTFERCPPSSSHEASGALFRLHKAQWNARGMPGVITENVAVFLRAALSANETAQFYLARYREETIGVLLGFSRRERFFYYISGIDPDFRKYGIGNLLVGYTLQQALHSGHVSFDFLRGGEAYKYAWGARDQQLWSRCLTAPAP